MGEDKIVIRLDDSDGEGKSGEGILDKSLSGIGGHFFVELDEAQAGTAVDGGEVIESSALYEVGDQFYIDLEEVAGARDDEGSAVAWGAEGSFAGEAVAFEDFADRKGGRDLKGAMV